MATSIEKQFQKDLGLGMKTESPLDHINEVEQATKFKATPKDGPRIIISKPTDLGNGRSSYIAEFPLSNPPRTEQNDNLHKSGSQYKLTPAAQKGLSQGISPEMLVLSRQRDESIIIGDNIVITVVDIRGDKVRLGINAPTEIPVHRQEVYEAIQRENQRGTSA